MGTGQLGSKYKLLLLATARPTVWTQSTVSFALEFAIQNASAAFEFDATSQPTSETSVDPLTEMARGTVGESANTHAEDGDATTLATARARITTGCWLMMAEKNLGCDLVKTTSTLRALPAFGPVAGGVFSFMLP